MTDELDRRVLSSYLNKFYCEDVLAVPNYQLSPLPTYIVPAPGPLPSFKDYVASLPPVDPPEAFGQHANAEISYLIEDSKVRAHAAACRWYRKTLLRCACAHRVCTSGAIAACRWDVYRLRSRREQTGSVLACMCWCPGIAPQMLSVWQRKRPSRGRVEVAFSVIGSARAPGSGGGAHSHHLYNMAAHLEEQLGSGYMCSPTAVREGAGV